MSDRWSYSAGQRPYTVTVYERSGSPNLYYRIWSPGDEKHIRRSLGHSDRDEAVAWADEQAATLRRGKSDLRKGRISLERLFRLYREHRTPEKSENQQYVDGREFEMWKRVLGPEKEPHQISSAEWKRFLERRASGEIDARGKAVPERDRRAVKPRTVQIDCRWLNAVMNWATGWRHHGNYLLDENPIRGFPVPEEKDPTRHVATQDQYEALMEIADHVEMEVRWDGETKTVRSHFAEILTLVNGTGRRISAVCAVRYEDLLLDRGPHGAIRWRADADKQRRETYAPINAEVQEAVDRARKRPPLGGPLFPAPRDATEPVSRHLARKWFRRAEELARMEHEHGFGFHAFRRKWVVERKDHSDADVAEAGGWKSLQALRHAYQQPDQERMLEVVTESRELRETGGN